MDRERLTPNPARRRGLRMAAVLAVGAGLTLSACGGATKQSAASAVGSAAAQLGRSSSLSVQVSLDVTPQQAQTLSTQGGSTLTTAEATALSNGHLFFTVQTGHGEGVDSSQAVTDPNNAYDLGLEIGTSKPVEIQYNHQNLYVRADLAQLFQDVGQDPSKAASFQKELATLNNTVPGISDLGAGKWVEVTSSSLSAIGGLLKQAAASGGAAQPSASQVQATLAQLRTALASSLQSNSTYSSQGTSGGRSEYRDTVNLHGFLASFGQAVQTDLGSVPLVGPQISSGVSKLEGRVPAGRTGTAEVFVSGDKLSEVDVDLNQFATHPVKFPVPLKVTFSSPPALLAPPTATPLDLSQLPALLQQLITGHLAPKTSTSGGAAQ